MDFSLFDRRGYPVISIEHGYAEWASNYDATVAAGLDGPLLESFELSRSNSRHSSLTRPSGPDDGENPAQGSSSEKR